MFGGLPGGRIKPEYCGGGKRGGKRGRRHGRGRPPAGPHCRDPQKASR